MVAFYVTLWGFTKQLDDKFPLYNHSATRAGGYNACTFETWDAYDSQELVLISEVDSEGSEPFSAQHACDALQDVRSAKVGVMKKGFQIIEK